jgi:hypothetical protein
MVHILVIKDTIDKKLSRYIRDDSALYVCKSEMEAVLALSSELFCIIVFFTTKDCCIDSTQI